MQRSGIGEPPAPTSPTSPTIPWMAMVGESERVGTALQTVCPGAATSLRDYG